MLLTEASLDEATPLDEATLAELLALPAPHSFQWERSSYSLSAPDAPLLLPSPQPSASLCVEMERSPRNLEGTWTCYKNAVLPRIRVEALGPVPDRATVRLSAVTLHAPTETATSCGLNGETLQPLVHGQCTFSSLSFKTTSYNLKGKHLHLLASLLVPAEDAYGGAMAVLASFISPPIRVESRKRQPKVQSQLIAVTGVGGGADGRADATALTLTPFPPEVLERRLEKVEKAEAGSRKQLRCVIDNSMEGLRAYLSAVNIRNKCKHPLFLILRFDACVGLFYDPTRSSNPSEDDGAFERMMEVLAKASAEGGGAVATTGALPVFVMAVKASHDSAQACDKLDCPVRLSAALSLPSCHKLPSHYKMLCEHQLAALRRTYCRLHTAHHAKAQERAAQAAWRREGDEPLQPRELLHEHPVDEPAASRHCGTCGVREPPRESGDVDVNVPDETQQSACSLSSCHFGEVPRPEAGARLLGALQVLVEESATMASSNNGGTGQACPQADWEQGLAILATAMAQHCPTRSPTEIFAFMRGQSTS